MASLVFPADLASDQQKHFMKIRIFPNPNGSAANQNQAPTIYLFIPGSGENGSMLWQMAHAYDEIKLTRLGVGVLGAVGSAVSPMATAAASTVAGYAGAAARAKGLGTINPKIDLVYGNTQLRDFEFSFFLSPQSEKETKTVDSIVRTLRMYSSPEITRTPPGLEGVPTGGFFTSGSGQVGQLQSGLWFIPPAEFMVSFHTVQPNATNLTQISEQENPYLPKIGRCVLSRVDVNYNQQGEYSTFKDGSPVNLYLTLVFSEMRVISQQDIRDGY